MLVFDQLVRPAVPRGGVINSSSVSVKGPVRPKRDGGHAAPADLCSLTAMICVALRRHERAFLHYASLFCSLEHLL